jgi:hypothetical protein
MLTEAVPAVAPPPFSEVRCAELDAGGQDYEAMSEDELKRRVQLKKIGLHGRHKMEYKIKVLRAADAEDMTQYQSWEGKAEREIKEAVEAIQVKKHRAEYEKGHTEWGHRSTSPTKFRRRNGTRSTACGTKSATETALSAQPSTKSSRNVKTSCQHIPS